MKASGRSRFPGRTLLWPLLSTVRTTNGGGFSSFQGVPTGLLGTSRSLAASATFDQRRQRQAAPNTSPRVRRRVLQQDVATVEVSLHALETRPFPHTGLSKRRDLALRRSQLGSSSAEGQPARRWPCAILGGLFSSRPGVGGQSKRTGSGPLAQPRWQGSTVPQVRRGKGARPLLAPVRRLAPRGGPAGFSARSRRRTTNGSSPPRPCVAAHEAKKRCTSNASCGSRLTSNTEISSR